MYFIFSNNTQRILAMGLGTCQEKKKKKKDLYAENCVRLPAISNSGSSEHRATQCCSRDSKKQSTKGNGQCRPVQQIVQFWTAATISPACQWIVLIN